MKDKWLEQLADIWRRSDKEGARFRVGDLVEIIYAPEHLKSFIGKQYKIVAMNFVGEDEGNFEYILDGYPLLVWENQIK